MVASAAEALPGVATELLFESFREPPRVPFRDVEVQARVSCARIRVNPTDYTQVLSAPHTERERGLTAFNLQSRIVSGCLRP